MVLKTSLKTKPNVNFADSSNWQSNELANAAVALHNIQKDAALASYVKNWSKSFLAQKINADNISEPAVQHSISIYLKHLTNSPKDSVGLPKIKTEIDSLRDHYKVNFGSETAELYQVMPLWAHMARRYQSPSYLEKLFQIYMYSKNVEGLYSEQDLLWWQNTQEKAPNKNTLGRNIIKARCNALLVAGLATVMDQLPAGSSYFNEFGDTFAEMIIAMMNLQDEDGLWPDSLSDFNINTNNKDIVASAMITQAMAWGVHKGRLDKDTFKPILAKAYKKLSAEFANPQKYRNNPQAIAAFVLASVELAKI